MLAPFPGDELSLAVARNPKGKSDPKWLQKVIIGIESHKQTPVFTSNQGQCQGYQWFWTARSFLKAIPIHLFQRSAINYGITRKHHLPAKAFAAG